MHELTWVPSPDSSHSNSCFLATAVVYLEINLDKIKSGSATHLSYLLFSPEHATYMYSILGLERRKIEVRCKLAGIKQHLLAGILRLDTDWLAAWHCSDRSVVHGTGWIFNSHEGDLRWRVGQESGSSNGQRCSGCLAALICEEHMRQKLLELKKNMRCFAQETAWENNFQVMIIMYLCCSATHCAW